MVNKGAANIRDVAKHAGVSIATVSRAILTPEAVASDTLRRVTLSISELGYTPNTNAQRLRTNRTSLIIALVPNIANPFYSEMLSAIQAFSRRYGYSVLLGDTGYDLEREQEYVNMVSARQADGIIGFLPRQPHRRGGNSIPAVNACCGIADPMATTIDIDNEAAAGDATDYLIALGHRSIGFIAGPSISPNSVARHNGYLASLAKAGLPTSAQLSLSGDFTVESGFLAAEKLLDRNPKMTAIFCANDEMALGAMRAAQARGLNVPEHLSVVGFDDIRFAKHFDPPLTTVAYPMEQIGTEATRLLFEILEDHTTPARTRVMSATLVLRKSTGPPSRKSRR